MSNTSPLNPELVLLHEDAAEVTIRDAAGDDLGALERLAQLDSTRPLVTGDPKFRSRNLGMIVVAEVGGELRAAYSLTEERAIADPFHRTVELVELLELHAGQMGTNGRAIARRSPALGTQAVTRAARA
ncbi:MAG: hypothetical protein ACRDL3_09520 [Solirubrobacterales bacterium]